VWRVLKKINIEENILAPKQGLTSAHQLNLAMFINEQTRRIMIINSEVEGKGVKTNEIFFGSI
jgi:hypothetical protein